MIRLGLIVMGIAFLVGCTNTDDYVEIAETSEPHHSTLTILSEVVSSMDIIEDLATSDPFFFKKSDLFLPDAVDVVYLDNTYDDGDGLEVELNFGELGTMPHGILCKDGKYRAGVLKLKLNKPFHKKEAELEIEFDDDEPFYTGDGEHMVQFVGDIELERAEKEGLVVIAKKLQVAEGQNSHTIECELVINKVQDVGIGLFNDVNEIKGELTLHGENRTIEVEIVTPLKKKYLNECAKHIVSGTLDVYHSNSASDIHIDFDPYENEACDNDISVTVNGKTVIETY